MSFNSKLTSKNMPHPLSNRFLVPNYGKPFLRVFEIFVYDTLSLAPRLWPDLQCMNAIIAASGSWPLALHLLRPRDSTSPASRTHPK